MDRESAGEHQDDLHRDPAAEAEDELDDAGGQLPSTDGDDDSVITESRTRRARDVAQLRGWV